MSYHSRIRLICFGLVSRSPLVSLGILSLHPQVSETIGGISPCHLSSPLFVVLSFVRDGTKPLCTANIPPTLDYVGAVPIQDPSAQRTQGKSLHCLEFAIFVPKHCPF